MHRHVSTGGATVVDFGDDASWERVKGEERLSASVCIFKHWTLQTIREVSSDEESRYLVGGPQKRYEVLRGRLEGRWDTAIR
jgi:hypothetical protein